jgi:hypothetical protein
MPSLGLFRVMPTCFARLCLRAFWSASWTIRKTATSLVGDSRTFS